ncbi:hypothetical protein BH10PSE18_BH10PSE18_25000 [soil metagenome]|jgi:hypothetical protein
MQHHSSTSGRWLWFGTLAVAGLAFATLIARPLHPKHDNAARPSAAGENTHAEMRMPCADAMPSMRAMLERRMRRHDARRFTA